MKLVFYYSFFALIAILTNFLVQEFSLQTYEGLYSLWISIFLGTLVGLIVKFYLDKRFIFKYMTQSQTQNFSIFLLYSVMGAITTSIFWGFELGFYYLFDSNLMKYIGGFIGLVLGYMAKYYLDKRFVFTVKNEKNYEIK